MTANIDIVRRAADGDESVLSDPRFVTVRDSYGMTPLHHLANENPIAALKHPDVASVHEKNYFYTPLHIAAERLHFAMRLPYDLRIAAKAIVAHRSAAEVKSHNGSTPLHLLALTARYAEEVMSHPKVALARTSTGDTPLHYLALARTESIINHPKVGIVENNDGETPEMILVRAGNQEAEKRRWDERAKQRGEQVAHGEAEEELEP